MKKVLAILLAMAMTFALVACAADNGGDAPATPAGGNDGGSAATPLRTGKTDIGFFNPDYDYFANDRLRFAYLRIRNSPLYEDMANSFRIWAELANVEVSIFDANDDDDLFNSMLEMLVLQGYDGLLLDPEMVNYPAVVAIMRDLGVPFMPGMGLPLDADTGRLTNPFVGFDFRFVGEEMGRWLVQYWQDNWQDVPIENIGFMGVDWSHVHEISVRIDGAKDIIFPAIPGIEDRFFRPDTIVGTLNSSTAYQVAGPVFAANPDITHWLILGTVDDFADGAVTAARDAGLEGQTVAISMGGPGLMAQWEAGIENDFKASFVSIGVIFAEPIFFGLYALVMGYATEETLFAPEWINHSNNETFAYLMLPTIIITRDTWHYYMEWVDLYTGLDVSNFPVTPTIDMFSARLDPPAHFAGG
ncbi:MAG: substrate-binding domain-containing protein [Oscillospiraceae bacterium]|nr:substrate-binding domain-containing protein [Oscillospiraceae bacterium]